MFKRFFIGFLIFISIILIFQLKTFAITHVAEKYSEEISNGLSTSDIFFLVAPDKTLLSTKTDISETEKNANNNVIIGLTIFLFVYWLILLLIYERESSIYTSFKENDEAMFNKYNPLIAGCIANSRGVLGRDILAVILNLVNKKIVKLEIRKSVNSIKSENDYQYLISRCKEKEYTMDNTEKYVHCWIFEDVHFEDEQIDLVKRLQTISKQGNTYKKLEELSNIATDELNNIGANKAKVPSLLKAYHVLFMVVVLFVVSKHIMANGLNIDIYYSTVLFGLIIFGAILFVIPLVVLMGYVVLKIIAYFRRVINIINENITGQKIISTTISIFIVFGVIILLTFLFAESKYLIFDELLIGIMFLIIKTDHLMLKNDKKILEDYYHIRYIKDKIEEYSLLDEKDIEHIVLWEQYLTYSISFGNSDKISDKMKKVYHDDKMILALQNYDFLYHVSKSYLEVFWEMEFEKKKNPQQTIFDFLLT